MTVPALGAQHANVRLRTTSAWRSALATLTTRTSAGGAILSTPIEGRRGALTTSTPIAAKVGIVDHVAHVGLGALLPRDVALTVPNLDHLWQVADHIVTDDPRVATIDAWLTHA